MDDTKLLELASIAAGEKFDAKRNPLERDDLALRLAVKLDLNVATNWRGGEAIVADNENLISWSEPWGDDKLAAVRRAITRAAAAMADAESTTDTGSTGREG